MNVELNPELQAKVDEWSAQTGRPASELVEDAVGGYLADLAEVRSTLDSRYDDIKSGRVEMIDGEAFFEQLRLKEEDLLKLRSAG